MAFAYAVFAQFLNLEVAALLEKKNNVHILSVSHQGHWISSSTQALWRIIARHRCHHWGTLRTTWRRPQLPT